MKEIKQIKVYEAIREDTELSFGISRMENIYDKRQGEIDEPHRHNYYTIVFTKKAGGEHLVDFESFELQSNQVYFIHPGQVHQIIETERSEGYAIVFSTKFLNTHQISVKFLADLALFMTLPQFPPLQLNTNEVENLSVWCEKMIANFESNNLFSQKAIASLLQLFLIDCFNHCKLPEAYKANQQKGLVLYNQFFELLDRHYTEWHSPQTYAEALFISTDHLNRTLKQFSGRTTKRIIQDRIIVEAKRSLYFTNNSAKEIGYDLGFSEPANFSNFFKKGVGHTPNAFRKASRKKAIS